MSNRNGDMPAFPTYELNGQGVLQDTSYGLTKRERFAMAALQGFLTDSVAIDCAVTDAVRAADALLAELERTSGGDS